MKSFFVSYNQADRAWAEWIAWNLEEAGYTTLIQAWDFRPGSNFVLQMQEATSEAERTIAVLSPSYLRSLYTQSEWAAAFRGDPTGQSHRLIPVRVEACDTDGLLSQIVWIDLIGVRQDQAAERLLAGVSNGRAKPLRCPAFPGEDRTCVDRRPRFPGDRASDPSTALTSPPRPASPDRDSASAWEAWLVILAEIMMLPEARRAVIDCQVDCDAMCQQIDDLLKYKDLHDQLHQLQFHCYDPIVSGNSASTIDDDARDTLSEYELNLQGIIENLRETNRRLDPDPSRADWIQCLAEADDELRGAIKQADTARLRRAASGIRRVLDRQPARINDWIFRAARELRLHKLVRALARVCDELTEHEIHPKKAEEFRAGLADLSRLTEDLDVTKDCHAQWQDLDVDLRLIDGRLDRSADDLVESWPHVMKVIDPLCGGSEDDWAIQFRAAAERLDLAISTNDQNTATLFRKFRRRAGLRFYKVDTDMKRLCEQLHRTGLPLATTLRVIR